MTLKTLDQIIEEAKESQMAQLRFQTQNLRILMNDVIWEVSHVGFLRLVRKPIYFSLRIHADKYVVRFPKYSTKITQIIVHTDELKE